MDQRPQLYQQFDSAKPLEPDDESLYVDWQNQVGLEDLKPRLAQSIAFTSVPVCRFLTGHRGTGKTTELKRLKQAFENGVYGRKLFVSFLEAERFMALHDVTPYDIVFHISQQLAADLQQAGVPFAAEKFLGLFADYWSRLELADVKLKAGIGELGFTLKDAPSARRKFREVLEAHLPDIYDLVNQGILKPARQWLQDHGGFEGILVIVDQLDRLQPGKVTDPRLTYLENIFLGNPGALRFLNCDVLYTVPIELVYSACRKRLEIDYSAEIFTLPVIPVARRDGGDFDKGLEVLRQIVMARASNAEVRRVDEFFSPPELLNRICRVSGGHLRHLFLLIRSAIERSSALPLTEDVVERTVRGQANNASRALGKAQWDLLRQVHNTGAAGEGELWYGLLRDLFAFEYDDGRLWYDWNPLLAEVSE